MLRLVLSLLVFSICQVVLAQDGSLIANMKTSHLNSEIQESFTGLWEVTSVEVGRENLTPIAKWFQMNEDGTSTGGNGWVQNSETTWTFDEISNEILFSTAGIPDEYGGFVLRLSENQMSWTRNEEGEQVTVLLQRIDKKPLAPWDKIVGIWEWTGMETLNLATNTTTTAAVESDWTRIRWDRRYVTVDGAGKRKETGIWHIDGHQPILTIFDDQGERYTWQIEFSGDQMIWVSEKQGEKTTLLFEKTTTMGN